MHIHTEDLARIREIAEANRGMPIDGGLFLHCLEQIALRHPQTLLELLRHIEQGEPLTPGPYE